MFSEQELYIIMTPRVHVKYTITYMYDFTHALFRNILLTFELILNNLKC